MITLNQLVRKNDHVSNEQFKEYWLGRHADEMVGLCTSLGIQKYTKCEALLEDPVTLLLQQLYGTASGGYDFVDHMVINDLADFKQAISDPDLSAAFKSTYQASMEYIDPQRSDIWFTVDVPQLYPLEGVVASPESTLLKCFYIGPHRQELTMEEAMLHWNACHGGLARQYTAMLPYDKYVQGHRTPSLVVDQLKQVLGGNFENDARALGQAEVWLDRRVVPSLQGPEVERMMRLLAEDIGLFVPPEKAHMFASKEHVLFSRSLVTDRLPRLFSVD
jgi:EthD domain